MATDPRDRTWLEFFCLPGVNLFMKHDNVEKATEELIKVSDKLTETLEKSSFLPGNFSEILQLTGKIIPNTFMARTAGQRGVKALKQLARGNGWRNPGFYLNTAACVVCTTSCAVGVFCKIGPTTHLQAFLYSSGTFLGTIADGLEGKPPSDFPPEL